jgi:hypothetical protein
MKPNLFNNATKELSQDGFFAWLLSWGDSDNQTANADLHETAKDFVRMVIDKPITYDVQKVEVKCQWNNIDITATVNDEFFVVIEDKTSSNEHSRQLDRYKEIATNYCSGNQLTPCFIYLKTGNENLKSLLGIEEKGYRVVGRKCILDILNNRDVKNDIFNDFRDHLRQIEAKTLNYANFNQSVWAAQGFYLELQPLVENSKWEYVSTPQGGFWGFTMDSYIWIENENIICGFWIQLENPVNVDKGVRLVVKVELYKPDRDTILNELKTLAEKQGITLNKPNKTRKGKYSTLATVPYDFSFDAKGCFDFQALADMLKKLDGILKEYKRLKEEIINGN